MRPFLLLLVVLLLSSIGNAQLNNWDIDISIEDDDTTYWTVTLDNKEPVQRTDYFITSRLTGVEVIADGQFIDCEVSEKELGTSIVCEDVNAAEIIYRFRALDLVTNLQDLSIFNYRFSITRITDQFSVIVRLPLGKGIVEKSKLEQTGLLPFEPIWGQEGSDGRRIFILWDLEDPDLGTSFDASVIYERITEVSVFTIVAVIIVAIAVMIFFILSMRKRTVKDVLPVLTEGERKVMEILIREKKPVDQRKIVLETDFSKPKVSRIIQNLMNRELIEKTPKGRTNMIKLKRKA